MSDSFHFDITGAPLEVALAVATHERPKVSGWRADNEGNRLVLFWADSPTATKFPVPLDATSVLPIVSLWLDSVEYGDAPSHDGGNKKGFRVYNEQWGCVGGEWQAFAAIELAWLTFGK